MTHSLTMLHTQKRCAELILKSRKKKKSTRAWWAFCLWARAERPAGIKGSRWRLPDPTVWFLCKGQLYSWRECSSPSPFFFPLERTLNLDLNWICISAPWTAFGKVQKDSDWCGYTKTGPVRFLHRLLTQLVKVLVTASGMSQPFGELRHATIF